MHNTLNLISLSGSLVKVPFLLLLEDILMMTLSTATSLSWPLPMEAIKVMRIVKLFL